MTQQYDEIVESPFLGMEIADEDYDQLQCKKGQFIYCEGSTPLGAHFVNKGKVKISRIGSDGKEQIMRIATPGEMLSYTDLISNTRYTTSAKALEDGSLLFIPKQDFWNTMKEQNKLYEQFVQMLSKDLTEAEERITDLAYKPVRGRLADALVSLAKKFNKNEHLGNMSIHITRSDLACFVGTAKETVNRLVSEFRKEQIITTEGTRINIVNLQKLKSISRLYE